MWISPITDRTTEDVANKTAKAFLNAADLNRIEGNIKHVADILKITITTKTWQITDFPNGTEMQRILDNLAAVKSAYFVKSTTPSVPTRPINIFWKVNNIEQITNDIYEMIQNQANGAIYINEIYLGQEIGVI